MAGGFSTWGWERPGAINDKGQGMSGACDSPANLNWPPIVPAKFVEAMTFFGLWKVWWTVEIIGCSFPLDTPFKSFLPGSDMSGWSIGRLTAIRPHVWGRRNCPGADSRAEVGRLWRR